MDNDQIVQGVLHAMTKMVIGSASKAGKTWMLIDQAMSVAHGQPWLGMPTKQTRVLYINLEILPSFFCRRMLDIAAARHFDPKCENLYLWNLRGYNSSYEEMMPKIINRVRNEGFGLIIIDPIYKMLGDADENKAGDVTKVMNSVESLSNETSAAISFVAHFSKGNQSQKIAMDRISGSGVFARDPDTIMLITEHEEPDCYTIEFTLRNFKPLKSFVVRWDYPVFRVAPNLEPLRLKQQSISTKPSTSLNEVLELLASDGLSTVDWMKTCRSELGISESTFYKVKAKLVASKAAYQEGKKWFPFAAFLDAQVKIV